MFAGSDSPGQCDPRPSRIRTVKDHITDSALPSSNWKSNPKSPEETRPFLAGVSASSMCTKPTSNRGHCLGNVLPSSWPGAPRHLCWSHSGSLVQRWAADSANQSFHAFINAIWDGQQNSTVTTIGNMQSTVQDCFHGSNLSTYQLRVVLPTLRK